MGQCFSGPSNHGVTSGTALSEAGMQQPGSSGQATSRPTVAAARGISNSMFSLWGENGFYDAVVNNKPILFPQFSLSRSTLEPSNSFASFLIERFEKNRVPNLRFGLEVEGYGKPGIDSLIGEKFSTNPPIFTSTSDDSLTELSKFPGREFVSKILQDSEDLRVAQNVLSALKDRGFFSDVNSGVHVHFDVSRLTENGYSEYDAVDKSSLPTPFQLQFIKNFVVHLAFVQELIAPILRMSNYAKPMGGGFPDEDSLNKFIGKVNGCEWLLDLEYWANPKNSRHYILNLHAFYLYGSLEFRGATKSFSDFMDVDPNLPILDICFIQDLVKMAFDATHNSPGVLDEIVKGNLEQVANQYVQDALKLGVVHALTQRDLRRGFRTMVSLLQHAPLLTQESMKELGGGFQSLKKGVSLGAIIDSMVLDFFEALNLIQEAKAEGPQQDNIVAEFFERYKTTHANLDCTYADYLNNNQWYLWANEPSDGKHLAQPIAPDSPRALVNRLFQGPKEQG